MLDYCSIVFEKFFNRELEIDQEQAVAGVINLLGMSSESYLEYLNGEGVRAYEDALEEAMEDQIFGVPLFVIDGQQFLGHDRRWLIEKYLEDSGASR